VVVLYTGAVGSGATSFPVPFTTLAGIDGRPLKPSAGNRVPIPDGLTYVYVDRNELGRHLNANTVAMSLWNAGHSAAPPRQPASPIVLRFQIDPDVCSATLAGYNFHPPNAGNVRLTARVFNLDDRAHQVTIGLSISPSGASFITAPQQTVNVAQQSHADVFWDVNLKRPMARSSQIVAVFVPQDDSGAASQPLTVRLLH